MVATGDTGFQFDLFYIDKLQILNTKPLAYSNSQALEFLAPTDASAFKVAIGDASRPQRVYVTQDNGNAALIVRPKIITEEGVRSLYPQQLCMRILVTQTIG